MIDTVKIAVPFRERPKWLNDTRWDTKRNATNGFFTKSKNPSKSYKRSGIYVPKVEYVERPATESREKSYTLYIELSLPKLYFGNNFNELTDELFSAVVNKLSVQLEAVYGIRVLPSEIEQAPLSRVDYSKNIIFTDGTPVSTIISSMKLADIPKTYDIQENFFRNGGLILHIHTNSMDVVMYDKVADLKQAKISAKRTHEKDQYSQLNLISEFEKHKNVTIPRWEIRLNNRRTIRKQLKAIGVKDDVNFSYLFNSDISRKILLLHWKKIFDLIPKSDIVANSATQILLSFKQANPDVKFAEASAFTIMQLLRIEAQDEREVRNLIEKLFGIKQYYRLKKKGRNPPTRTQLQDLLFITRTLRVMMPVGIDDFIK
jgi:hypothetical protein